MTLFLIAQPLFPRDFIKQYSLIVHLRSGSSSKYGHGRRTCQFEVENFLARFGQTFFGSLETNRFCDVTLEAEGKQIKAHRIILSAASKYFQHLFDKYDDDLLIEIKLPMPFDDLVQIICFAYTGEINIQLSSVPRFLAVTKFLKMNGTIEEPILEEIETLPEFNESKSLNISNISNISAHLTEALKNITAEQEMAAKTMKQKESVLKRKSQESPRESSSSNAKLLIQENNQHRPSFATLYLSSALEFVTPTIQDASNTEKAVKQQAIQDPSADASAPKINKSLEVQEPSAVQTAHKLISPKASQGTSALPSAGV